MTQDLTSRHSRFRTRATLLKRARNPDDEEACNEIFKIYSPLIYSVGIQAGLTRSEAEDLRQETMVSLFRKLPQFDYNPARGRFRTWLAKLIKWRIKDQLRKRRLITPAVAAERETRTNRTATVARIADPRGCALEELWDEEIGQRRNQVALANLKEVVNARDLQVFALYVLNDWPADKVAQKLAVTRQQVYNARIRILPLYRKQIRRLKGKLL